MEALSVRNSRTVLWYTHTHTHTHTYPEWDLHPQSHCPQPAVTRISNRPTIDTSKMRHLFTEESSVECFVV
jgi:hypothetical protein